MFKKISPLNLVVYGSIAALAAIVLILGFPAAGATGISLAALRYYFSITLSSLEGAFLLAVYFLVIFMVFLVAYSNGKNLFNALRRNGRPPTMFGKKSVREGAIEAGRILWRGLCAVSPAVVFVVLLSLVLARVNAIDQSRLADVRIIGWEHAVFGTYGFLALGNIHYPTWLIQIIIFSFENMSGAIIIAAFIVGALRYSMLRELVAAFCCAMFLSVGFWVALPALSPQDRFIDNIYHLPVPSQIASAVMAYHPQQEIQNFLNQVRKEKGELTDLPTSTIPSAHVIWAILAGYYLWRTRKWLGWAALPFLIASTLGTVLFAQHYVMDVPLAIIVSIFSIAIVRRLERPMV